MGDVNNKTGYSIVKSFKPLVVFCVSIVVVSDIIFLSLILLIVGLRNALGLDAELVGFTVLLFMIKSIVTASSLYTTLRSWLGVTYFVTNHRLYIQSDVRQVNSVIIELKDVHKAVSKDSYRFLNKTEYGDVILEFTSRTSSEKLVLHGVNNPQEVAKRLLDR